MSSRLRRTDHSRLSRFECLPPIGVSVVPHPPLERREIHSNVRIRRRHHHEEEEEEEKIELSIHLPDGRRIRGIYSSSTRLRDVFLSVDLSDLSLNEVYFSSADRPKRQFLDWNQTIRQAQIPSRSMDLEEHRSRGDFYRQLLVQSRVFLTELDDEEEEEDRQSSIRSRSTDRLTMNKRQDLPSRPMSTDSTMNVEFSSTRQRCYQRLLSCSRRKLRLLTIQEQNERRHAGFQRFVDSLDEKRCADIRRYQMELKEYLLNRLETDRLKEELLFLNQKIDGLKKEKENYSTIIEIVEKAIPLFPAGLLQGGADGVKNLILRYQTLVENKEFLQDRDFSEEKQALRQKFQRLILEKNTQITQLSTRLAQLYNQSNDIEKKESIKEQKTLEELDLTRVTNTALSQLLSSITSLYERHRLTYQVKQSIGESKSKDQTTPKDKLRSIQEFVIYRIDLAQRAK